MTAAEKFGRIVDLIWAGDPADPLCAHYLAELTCNFVKTVPNLGRVLDCYHNSKAFYNFIVFLRHIAIYVCFIIIWKSLFKGILLLYVTNYILFVFFTEVMVVLWLFESAIFRLVLKSDRPINRTFENMKNMSGSNISEFRQICAFSRTDSLSQADTILWHKRWIFCFWRQRSMLTALGGSFCSAKKLWILRSTLSSAALG